MLFSATPVGAAAPNLYNMWHVRKIKAQGTGSIITFSNQRGSVEVTQTPAAIYAQQTGGKSLSMLLLTETGSGDSVIVPAYRVKQAAAKGTGSKVVLYQDEYTVFCDETPAAIIAQQSPQVLHLVLVTRASDSVDFVLNVRELETVLPSGGGSEIIRTYEQNMVVTQNPAAIFASQA